MVKTFTIVIILYVLSNEALLTTCFVEIKTQLIRLLDTEKGKNRTER